MVSILLIITPHALYKYNYNNNHSEDHYKSNSEDYPQKSENKNITEPCKHILLVNDDYIYCSNSYGIKRINKNNNEITSYDEATPLSEDTHSFNNARHSPNESKKYIYYYNYEDLSDSEDNTPYFYSTKYENHYKYSIYVIDVSTGLDTPIGEYDDEILTDSTLDTNGNLYYLIADDNNNFKAYYYDVKNKKLTKEKYFYRIDLLHNNIAYYQKRTDDNNINNLLYDLNKNKVISEKSAPYKYDSNVVANTRTYYLYGYQYKIYQNQISKYTMNNELLETIYSDNIKQYYRVNIYNKKLYLYGTDYNNYNRIDYIGLENDFTITKTDIDFDFYKRIHNNSVIYQDKIYYLSSNEYHLYSYDMNTKKEELVSDIRFTSIERIDDYYLSVDNYVIDLRDNSIASY